MQKLITLLLLLVAMVSKSQIPYNPFTQNIHFSPEPSPTGFKCGTHQHVVFTQGITTADSASILTDSLRVNIQLAGFVIDTIQVTGSYSSNFNWYYDSLSNILTGVQKNTLHGVGYNPMSPDTLSSGWIDVLLYVPEGLSTNTILSVDISLIIPIYMQAYNSLPDDNESSSTQASCELVLPIKLERYSVTESNCNVILNWQTQNEYNTAYTNIYRNNKLLSTVKNLNKEVNYYKYIDSVDKNGSYQYMLEFIEIDGYKSKSNVSSISINCKEQLLFYPNPFSDYLNISSDFKLFDISGKMICKGNGRINTTFIKPGIYFLNVNENNYKIIKN